MFSAKFKKITNAIPPQNKIIQKGVWRFIAFLVTSCDKNWPNGTWWRNFVAKKTQKENIKNKLLGIRQGIHPVIITIRTLLQNLITLFLQNRRKVFSVCPDKTASIFCNGNFDLGCQTDFLWWIGWGFYFVKSF